MNTVSPNNQSQAPKPWEQNVSSVVNVASVLLMLFGFGIQSAQKNDPDTLKGWDSTADWSVIAGAMVAAGSWMHNRSSLKAAIAAAPADEDGNSSATFTCSHAVAQAVQEKNPQLAKRLLNAMYPPDEEDDSKPKKEDNR